MLSAEERQERPWDGFLSVYDILTKNVLAYRTLADPKFAAFILQSIEEQRYASTVRYSERTETLMVFLRAGYGLSVFTRGVLSPDLFADRPITDPSERTKAVGTICAGFFTTVLPELVRQGIVIAGR